ncbi:EthD family reductase [Maribacter sp.]|nr:EthD family reductase [Maribacter sp.]
MKSRISIFLIALVVLASCQPNKVIDTPEIKKGMIKMAVLYPNAPGNTFDMEYYTNTHMPMTADLLGESLKGMTVEKIISSGNPDNPIPYTVIGYFYFENLFAMQNSMGTHRNEIQADVQNYTNSMPIVQISELVMAE